MSEGGELAEVAARSGIFSKLARLFRGALPLGRDAAETVPERGWVQDPTGYWYNRTTYEVSLTRPAELDGYTTVYRFHGPEPETLVPRHKPSAEELGELLSDPPLAQLRATLHATGFAGYRDASPFVSVTTDPAAAAATDEPWLKTIATGEPGYEGAARAPLLSEFRVPSARVYPKLPNLGLKDEKELLYLGPGLDKYLVRTIPNPY